MSVINATIGAGTRRMLQDVLAWNHARSQDINRVNAMAASGLLPRDANGNVQLPEDLLQGLWRPFPGSTSNVNVTNIGNGQPANGSQAANVPAASPASPTTQPTATQSVPPAPIQPAAAPTAPPQQSSSGGILSTLGNVATWIKLGAAGMGIGGAGLLGAWLASKPAQQIPKAAQEMLYELHLGGQSPPATGGSGE